MMSRTDLTNTLLWALGNSGLCQGWTNSSGLVTSQVVHTAGLSFPVLTHGHGMQMWFFHPLTRSGVAGAEAGQGSLSRRSQITSEEVNRRKGCVAPEKEADTSLLAPALSESLSELH